MVLVAWTSAAGLRFVFFFSSRRRHTRFDCDWSSDVCSSDLTYCLSYEGGLMPTRYESAGQKRDESAVKTSSIKTRSLEGVKPNSNFVSAMMMPFFTA